MSPLRLVALALVATTTLRAPVLPAQGTRPDSARKDSLARPAPPDGVVRQPHLARATRVCMGGDVTLGTNLDTAWAHKAARAMRKTFRTSDDPETLLRPLRPLVRDADVVLLNVEGAIGAGKAPRKCPRHAEHCFAFRQPPRTARALRRVAPGVVVGNVANNHARDAGPKGFDTTRALLRRAGVLVTGADTLATPVPLPTGDTIAVLGFHTAADAPNAPDARDLSAVRRHVARAAARWGTVIVTMHLGAEGVEAQRTRDSTELFLTLDRGNPVAFADSAIAGGATLVVGHGPHVLRAAEWRGDRLVLYSLGNLATYGPFRLKEPMNRGAIACATLDTAGRVAAAELRPTVQLAAGVVRPDSARRALTLVDSLGALDFPERGAAVTPRGALVPRAAVPPVQAADDRRRVPPAASVPPPHRR